MPHHPSLKEVLDKDGFNSDEWVEFNVRGLNWSVWVSAERIIGEQPNPEYNFVCDSLSSEFGKYSAENVFLNFEFRTEQELHELKGDPMPLGAFSYYSENEAIVTLGVTTGAYKDIIDLVRSGSGQLVVRAAVPDWEDNECKCVPITQYQLSFRSKGSVCI